MSFNNAVASQICQCCGACCSFFRASFYWGETTASPYGVVPVEMTAKLTHHLAVMNGTDNRRPRCVALNGDVGSRVTCAIYEHRPSTCREFGIAGLDGTPNPRCDQARRAYGLPAIDRQVIDASMPEVAA